MNQIFAVATITIAAGASIGLALLLEWVSLQALWRLMPARATTQRGKTL
ncbi:MAG TPA: hypothetical protein VMU43_14630 [Candidatus Acidoferrum sp.]|nr:hypothetical protein [Candidatus Acidoferrum sp.]